MVLVTDGVWRDGVSNSAHSLVGNVITRSFAANVALYNGQLCDVVENHGSV